MKKISWLSRLSTERLSRVWVRRVAGSAGAAAFLMATGLAFAQAPGVDTPDTQPVAPTGYSLHESIDAGGHMVGISGSGAMYDTMVNMESGPRILGETFQLRALPGTKNTAVDSLSAFSNGWGGDPYNFAKIDFYKGRIYEFSGLFRRDRQYFDYDLLGNPNIPAGLSTPIGPAGTPTGSLPWGQVRQSPFLFNTVRRNTDTNLTLLPLSKVTFRAGYSHITFEGPSLTPSGYDVALSYALMLQEYQRNSTDEYLGAVDWKPLKDTKLTFEEVVDHYKADSYFTMDPSYYTVQEADGTKAVPLISYDSMTPYSTTASCNANSVGTTPALSAPNAAGGLPVINPACAVVLSYLRTQPTRFLYPTEIFRFQSSSIRNVAMNGDVRYTDANMNLPSYYENFQGLTKTTRALTYTAFASAKRKVTAADYGIVWQASPKFSLADQFSFSNAQEPGSSTWTTQTTLSTPTTAGSETVNNGSLVTTVAAPGAGTGIGHDSVYGTPLPGFFGQRFISNDVTGTWDGWSRGTVSLTYRHQNHVIAEGLPHDAPLAVTNTPSFNNPTDGGTVTINQNGGILNVSLRPMNNWDVNGTVEMMFADNVFTPVAPRKLQRYRVHTLYKATTWATLSGAYNDLERHNNTNNTGVAPLDGPLDHVDHSRVGSLGAQIFPNEHYGLDFNYAYSDVYASTNICYLGKASNLAGLPVAATQSGTACPSPAANRDGSYDFGPTRDFMDAPTQSGSVAVRMSPNAKFASNIGYQINSVNGSRFYNDPRDVAGSLVSTYQSPFVNAAWTVHPGFIWNAQYNFYGYGEGGPSGAQYCSTTNPTPTTPATVVPCSSLPQTGMSISPAGETAPRNFHANMVTLGFHYEF